MKTFFVHDKQGRLRGWVEASDEADAKSMVDALYGPDARVSDRPDQEWYARRHSPPDASTDIAFAA